MLQGDKFDPGVANNFRSKLLCPHICKFFLYLLGSIVPDITANTSFPLSPIDNNQHPNLNVKVVIGSVLGGFVLALGCIVCVIRRIRLKGKSKRKLSGDPSLVIQDCIPYPISPPPTPPPAKLSREQRFVSRTYMIRPAMSSPFIGHPGFSIKIPYFSDTWESAADK